MENIGGEALARGRRHEQKAGAGLRQTIGGAAAAHAERQQHEAKEPGGRPHRQVGQDLIEARFDGSKPLCMHHSTSGRSAGWRPSSSQRLSTADNK